MQNKDVIKRFDSMIMGEGEANKEAYAAKNIQFLMDSSITELMVYLKSLERRQNIIKSALLIKMK